MMRFEAYNEHRTAVIKLFNYILTKPDLIIFFIPLLIISLSSALDFSDVITDGIIGNLKVEALLIIFMSVFLVWKKDETSHLDQTMATLDRHLRKAEVFANLLNKK